MWRIGFAFWMLPSSALAAEPPADPFAVHGVKLPVPIEIWRERLQYFNCEPSPDPKVADVSCVVEGESKNTMYAGQSGTIEAQAFGGVVGFVSLVDWDCSARKAEILVSALDERLGKRAGTQVDATLESPWWKHGNTEVRFRRGIDRNGNVRFCSVTYQTDGFRAEAARRQSAPFDGVRNGM